MTIETDTITLPAHWACALINGDDEGLCPGEIERIDALLTDGWYVASDVEDSERFTWSYRLYDPGAPCDGGLVADYVIHRSPR